jgi:hypothetical protein
MVMEDGGIIHKVRQEKKKRLRAICLGDELVWPVPRENELEALATPFSFPLLFSRLCRGIPPD